ncbi:MAG: cation diffusion facilitator family transporter [Alphaproteobacteria bacterium]|nr:cation diffusion facilitator family transporter [Alphaproteobacteria bacterium]
MTEKLTKNNRLMRIASLASVAVASMLIAAKAAAYLVTGSMAILSSLFDSIQDLMTSVINVFAIRRATEPADQKHRFGHGKAQAIGGLIQSGIIAMSSLFLLTTAIDRFINPRGLTQVGLGLGITLFALALTTGLITFQAYVLRRTKSLSIRADRAHYTGDILMNTGVIISILATYYLNWLWIDALFGICVSVYLLCAIYRIMVEALEVLMDSEMPNPFRRRIEETVLSFKEVSAIEDLKTRSSGDAVFVQMNVRMPGSLSLTRAHRITDAIESALRMQFPEAVVIIHPEPQ